MIANIKSTEGTGDNILKKKIHAGSESIMFSVLQESQYMYPFKSSVREIISNCLDSVTEKNNAIKILNEEIKVEDLFIIKEGEEFKDSSFNAEYYDKNWLSTNDVITILYIDNDTPTRDRIKFIDRGVGLGGTRLINYFSLGYSSKRLSKNQLGSFGLGAKSMLATGVDYYTVTSYYNGKEYSFNIFKDHVTPAIGKFNEDGTINKVETFFEGTENEYHTYYRDTKELNGVIIEAEVKRHRKQDFISSIENQLGYIENLEMLVIDGQYSWSTPYKRNIAAKVVYSNDDFFVGESDYYSVPQILLKPGENSNIKISYGTINFEELEMKKYSGNVCFVLNINEVDVTPSRESVIWNTKTREAIKGMFLKAQKTIEGVIVDSLKQETILPEYIYSVNQFKNKSSISGMNELYKIIDTSSIEAAFRGFDLNKVANDIENNFKKDLSMTCTSNLSSYNKQFQDTNYISALSNLYLSGMSKKATGADRVYMYIGETKYKNLGRYYASEFLSGGEKAINIIYLREELYNQLKAAIEKLGFETFLENAYLKKNSTKVLFAEMYRYINDPITKNYCKFAKDIDSTKMSNMEKIEEENKNSYYMSYNEKQKALGKVYANSHYSLSSTSRIFVDESDMYDAIIYCLSDEFATRLLASSSYSSIPSGIKILGLSQENYKRFYKCPGVKLLTDSLFKIEFGDISFTTLGTLLLSEEDKRSIEALYKPQKRGRKKLSDIQSKLNFLSYKFADFKRNNSIFTDKLYNFSRKKECRYDEYLEKQAVHFPKINN